MTAKAAPRIPKDAIRSEKLAPPLGPFSSAVRAGGFLFLSGQVGRDPATGKLVQGGIERQAEQVFTNIGTLLQAAGKSYEAVVRVGIFLTNMGDFAALNTIYARYFAEPFPARTTVGVATLPLGAVIEVDLIALD